MAFVNAQTEVAVSCQPVLKSLSLLQEHEETLIFVINTFFYIFC